jgi:fatty acid desaturase
MINIQQVKYLKSKVDNYNTKKKTYYRNQKISLIIACLTLILHLASLLLLFSTAFYGYLFLLVAFIFFFFQKRQIIILENQKGEILNEVNQSISQVSIQNYLALLQRIAKAGKY